MAVAGSVGAGEGGATVGAGAEVGCGVAGSPLACAVGAGMPSTQPGCAAGVGGASAVRSEAPQAASHMARKIRSGIWRIAMSLRARAAGEPWRGSTGVGVDEQAGFVVNAVGAPAALLSADTAPLLRIVCDWLLSLPWGQTSCGDELFRD